MSSHQGFKDVKEARDLLGTETFTTKVNAATQDLLACLRGTTNPTATSYLIRQAQTYGGRQLRIGVGNLPHGVRIRSAGAAEALESLLQKLEGVIYRSALWEMEKKGLVSYRDGKWWPTTPGESRQPRQRQRRRIATQPT